MGGDIVEGNKKFFLKNLMGMYWLLQFFNVVCTYVMLMPFSNSCIYIYIYNMHSLYLALAAAFENILVEHLGSYVVA